MAYEKLNLKNGDVLTAEHLEHIEEGIGNALEPDDVELIQELKGGGGTGTDGASYVFEHTLTISIKDADGNEVQKASITAVDPYRRALASGYKGSEFGFYNDVVAAVQGAWGRILIDGLDYDDTDNKLYLTSGGERVPSMSVILPTTSGESGMEAITPQMYGAKGDGVTDDTQAFIDALNDKGKVFVPEGVYVISSSLDLTQGKSLYGESGNRGTLKFTSATGNIIVLGEDSVFDNVDIWVPQQLDGNVFVTDNRLMNTTVSFLHTVVENTTIQIDTIQDDTSSKELTLINIIASNAAQGFCYQTYQNINVVRPNWNNQDVYAIYNNGIKMTLSADVSGKTDLSWITHLNFENVFLGSPVIAIKCGHENNAGVDISGAVNLIDHVMMTNVSAQVAANYSKKFWDLGHCRIKALNCKAWDYAEYVTDGKYGTMRTGARLSVLPLETSPVDNFEFPDDNATPKVYGHVYFLDKYFSLVKSITEGGTSENDPRYARRLTAEYGVYNYTDTVAPERISNSMYKISGHVPTLKNMGFSNYPIINGIQLNNGGYNGAGGAHTTIMAITQDNHWVFRKYYSGDWFGDWHRIYSDTDDELLKEKMTAIDDEGGYFASENVEGALQEIGAELAGINTLLGDGVLS